MTRPQRVLESVKHALKESGNLPDSTSYATFEIDNDGGQANVRPPAIEITVPDVTRDESFNTDFVGYVTDDQDNQIGYKFHARYEMTIDIDVWTAEGDGYDPDEIGYCIRQELYKYDDNQVGAPIPDPDGGDLSDISLFVLGDGGTRNDLTMTPALRRWRQTATIWFEETVNTEEDYITNLDFPDEIVN